MPKDPVCLMDVNEKAKLKKEHSGKIYYFCSKFCLEKFKEKPENYLVRHKDILGKDK